MIFETDSEVIMMKDENLRKVKMLMNNAGKVTEIARSSKSTFSSSSPASSGLHKTLPVTLLIICAVRADY